MIASLKFVVSCDILGLTKSFEGRYFGHAFSKAYQYVSTNEKVCKGLKDVSIKITQFDLQKCVTLLKKSRKGKQEWNKAYVDFESS